MADRSTLVSACTFVARFEAGTEYLLYDSSKLSLAPFVLIVQFLHPVLGMVAFGAGAAEQPPYSPYKSDATNFIYNLLFCDDLSAFAAKPGELPTSWQRALASSPIDVAALEALGSDVQQEGRLRYLAYRRLREAGYRVPAKQLLGVIVEVALSEGLDTLAAYAEGGVRYINHSDRLVVVEANPAFQPLVDRLFRVSETVVARLGPWNRPRLAPPDEGAIRLTFLLSDGLYFGAGPLSAMQGDPMAAPVIRQATELLQAVVAVGKR